MHPNPLEVLTRRFQDPAHHNIEASTVALKTCRRLGSGMLTHPNMSQLAQNAMVALANRFSTSTSKVLSKVTIVPSTLKPLFASVLRVISPLT